MQEVDKCVSFIQLRRVVDRQVKLFVCSLMRFVDFLLQFFLSVLVWDVADHHVSALLFPCGDSLDRIFIDQRVHRVVEIESRVVA
jgi:hypothetical protein